ncbi:unnamed protein product [Sphagnum balticum]
MSQRSNLRWEQIKTWIRRDICELGRKIDNRLSEECGILCDESGRTVGKGTFGKVKLGREIATGEPVAVKILDKAKIVDVSDVERVAREIYILKILRHPGIIQLYEIIETEQYLFLVMEYLPGGELFEHIVTRKR